MGLSMQGKLTSYFGMQCLTDLHLFYFIFRTKRRKSAIELGNRPELFKGVVLSDERAFSLLNFSPTKNVGYEV